MTLIRTIKYWIKRLSKPLQIWFQRRGRRETIITKNIVDRLLNITKHGDILLSYEYQRYTSLAIKGFYKHAVIVCCVDGIPQVIEAVGDLFIIENGITKNIGGVRMVPLEEWLYKKDYVAVIRTNLSEDIINKAGSNALQYIGRNYDYSFEHLNEEIYCSELPYVCYRTEWPLFLEEIPEENEILPQQYLDMCKHFHYLICVIDTHASDLSFRV